MRENRASHLVGLKTHPTILPRPGIELTTFRTPWLQTWARCPTPLLTRPPNNLPDEAYTEDNIRWLYTTSGVGPNLLLRKLCFCSVYVKYIKVYFPPNLIITIEKMHAYVYCSILCWLVGLMYLLFNTVWFALVVQCQWLVRILECRWCVVNISLIMYLFSLILIFLLLLTYWGLIWNKSVYLL